MIIKKGLFVFLSFMFIFNVFLVSSAEIPPPLVVQGFVKDKVLDNFITNQDLEVVVKTSGGAETIANLRLKNGNPDGYYDSILYAFPGEQVSVSAKIKGTSCFGIISELVPGGDETGLLNVNVNLCCSPSKASNFNPSDSLNVIGSTSIEFSWNSGEKGNVNYPDIWEDFKSLEIISNVETPLTLKVDSLSKWSVKTCNGIKEENSCCIESGVGSSFENSACPIPTNLKGVFEEGYIVTTWESSNIDLEGDKCYDVWEAFSLAEGDTFDNPSWTGSTNPANKARELAIAELVTYWKVKSCDDLDFCSDWAIAITPSCNKISEECPSLYKIKKYLDIGGGGIFNEYEEENKIFFNDFEETPFSRKSFLWILVPIFIFIFFMIYYLFKKKSKEKFRKKIKHK